MAAVLAGLYWPALPHPHVNPTFICAATGLVGAAASVKLTALVWYVFPLTHGKSNEPEEHLAELLNSKD